MPEPDDANVIPGDGPGEQNVPGWGIAILALYLLALTATIVWHLNDLWPRCDPNAQVSTANASGAGAPSADTSPPGTPVAGAGGTAGKASVKLDSVDPASGSTASREPVTLSGAGFKTGATVLFATAPAGNVKVVSADKITATTPDHATAEKVDVKVTNPDGKTDTLAGGYTYTTAPAPGQSTPSKSTPNPSPPNSGAAVKVTAVSPNSGDVAGCIPVQITGEGFLANPTVTFGGSPATEVQWKSATSIVAKTPAHAEGATDVVVTNSDKTTGTLPAGFLYDSCTSQCRSRLLVLVLLAGALGACFHALRSLWMFAGNRSLKQSWVLMYVCLPINGAVLAFIFFIVISAGSGFFSEPKGSNSCYWIIGIAALVGLFSQQAAEKLKQIAESLFSKVPPNAESLPAATSGPSIDPVKGPARTPVKITGNGFTATSTVTFGTVAVAAADLHFLSPSLITVKAPAGNQAGTKVDVVVTDPASGAQGVKAGVFTYDPAAAAPQTSGS